MRGYLAWLAFAELDGDPLGERRARDWAVLDYCTHLFTVAKRAPTSINNTLAALDDFYIRRRLGRAAADRLDLPTQAPRALVAKAANVRSNSSSSGVEARCGSSGSRPTMRRIHGWRGDPVWLIPDL
ncbi:MAG TPA: hypothetical protein VE155_06160 [Pseudonocardiaceae bacterium]|nr:hypothetical protein [Pseudonocardiaceae bacterium]